MERSQNIQNEFVRSLRNRDVTKSISIENSDEEQEISSERSNDDYKPVNPSTGNPHHSVSPKTVHSSSFPVTSVFPFPNDSYQGFTGSDAMNAVVYDCGVTEAPKVKLGLGRGIVSGPVETPLKNPQYSTKSHGNLQALNDDCADFSEEELSLMEAELRLRRLRLSKLRSKAESRHTSPGKGVPTASTSASYGLESKLNDLVVSMALPKVEMDCFDGDPSNLYAFLRSFDVNVACQLSDDSKKLSYLISYCKEPAKSSIRHCVMLPSNKGYQEAISILKNRYGRPYDVMQAATRDLLHGSRLTGGDTEGLKVLATRMRSCQITMQQLSREADLESVSFLIRLVELLPRHLQQRWAEVAQNLIDANKEPRFKDLLAFIERQVSLSSNPYGQLLLRQSDVIARSAATLLPQQGIADCVACKRQHKLFECPKFLSQPVDARVKFLFEHKLCFTCLRANHLSKDCKSRLRCTRPGCGRRHNSLIHNDSPRNEVVLSESKCGASNTGKLVCLGCVPLRIKGPLGTVSTYGFLDNGSDTTLVDRKLALAIGLNVDPCNLTIDTVNGRKRMRSSKTSLSVMPLKDDRELLVDCAYTVEQLPITLAADHSKLDMQKWPHLSDIELLCIPDKRVGILLGCDVPEAHEAFEQRIGRGRQPYAIKSLFGWVMRGPCYNLARDIKCVNYLGTEEESLRETLTRYFEAEFKEPGSEEQSLSIDDQTAMKIVEHSTCLLDNKFVVGLPWRENTKLPPNHRMAQYRLELLKKRLSRNIDLHVKYSEIIRNHMSKGYVSEVAEPDLDSRWFLPHHPVLNPNKPGKVRVVFDCAAQLQGKSLNQALLSGPDNTNDLVGVLIRFRKYPVAISADIEEMFLQVGVPESDRRYLSFLWWPDGDLNSRPRVYELNVHPFGATSSPFCASYALRRTTKEFSASYSEACCRAVLNNFYVDDCLVSTETVQEGRLLVDELRDMLSRGGFRLVKWNSTHPEILRNVPQDLPSTKISDKNLISRECLSVLGINWDTISDSLTVRLNLPQCPATRRGILKCVSSLFDPLGFVAPMSLCVRQLLQVLCKSGIGWDTPLSEEDSKRWLRWLVEVQSIKDLHIPRCMGLASGGEMKIELHMFSDASDAGYGAVGYLRMITLERISCAFVIGKSRVAPRKISTLPRMELVAAVLASKLMRFIVNETHLSFYRVIMWTDSTIVLHYLRNKSSRFTTFIANRIRVIHDYTKDAIWRHVPTESNPADVAARGSRLATCNRMKLWLNGPSFLCDSENNWPSDCVSIQEVESCPKTISSVISSPCWYTPLFDKYSSWTRLLKSVAWLTRFKVFIVTMKGSRSTGSMKLNQLNPTELRNAELDIIRLVQKECLGGTLNSHAALSFKRLNPMEFEGVWCVGSRIQGCSRSDGMQPIILPARHSVTDLIIRFFHEANGHVGATQVQAYIRQQFWVIKGMAQIRRVLRACPRCKLLYSSPMNQIMAPLPLERTTDDGYPFRFCGVDYFGPFKVRCGRSDNKRYGCLFTCLQTRAVHIEVAQSLSKDTFLMALLRFVNRRGKPEVMFSDNGTNFVGAENELKEWTQALDQRKIADGLLSRGIEWRFNPPSASHRGGVWERVIRSTRRILSAVMAEQSMSDEVLSTCLTEVERILNDRPLVPLYDDPEDLKALTPNDLLLLKNVHVPVDRDVTLADIYTKGWRQAQHIANTFWKRWIREYLPTLHLRQKWLKVSRDAAVGDLVLLTDVEKPRNGWKKGLIVKVHLGSDHHPREAEVKTVDGVVRKDIRSLCLLEGDALRR